MCNNCRRISRSPTTMSKSKAANGDGYPLPLEDTLRDLALLRASELDLSVLVQEGTSNEAPGDVERSYAFAREARAVIRMDNRCEVEKQGERLEGVRSTVEDALGGLGNLKDNVSSTRLA